MYRSNVGVVIVRPISGYCNRGKMSIHLCTVFLLTSLIESKTFLFIDSTLRCVQMTEDWVTGR